LAQFLQERGAGGFSRIDGTIEFYARVNALLDPSMAILDFGAGRGAGAEDPVPYRRELRSLRGKVKWVIGVDVDPVVLENPLLDEAHVLSENQIPLGESSVDLVLADYVFEHLENPVPTSREIARILKPGGWVCARTPNRWGYIGLGSALIPGSLQTRVVSKVQGSARQREDIFPTRYRLNSFRHVEKYFSGVRFQNYTYAYNPEPAYFGTSQRVNSLIGYSLGLLPECLSAILMVFLRKRDHST
jgi:SAM-dependent methyltransferase